MSVQITDTVGIPVKIWRRLAIRPYSTVTDFARLRGWSTSVPMNTAVK